MQRVPHAALGAALVAVLAAGCTSGPSDSPSGDPTAKPSASRTGAAGAFCSVADLSITLGRGDVTAGRAVYPLRAKNTSGRTCSIGGFGSVAFVTGDPGSLIGKPARPIRKGQAKRVVLEKGDRATASLRELLAGKVARRRCSPTLARGLRVSPPRDTSSVVVDHPTTACQSERVQQLEITPFLPTG